MDIIFKDDMVKESKTWKNPMLLFFVLAVLFPLTLIWTNIKITEFILGEVFFILILKEIRQLIRRILSSDSSILYFLLPYHL